MGFTSGGGFSNIYPRPAYQSSAVKSYLANNSPPRGFNYSGRGYPDVSVAGSLFKVVIGGNDLYVSGTSLSAPTVAGFFSNINAARHRHGKGSVGWVNPVLYANYSSFVFDITHGANANGACTNGFSAVAGWDPASGLGSMNYGLLQSTLVAMGECWKCGGNIVV